MRRYNSVGTKVRKNSITTARSQNIRHFFRNRMSIFRPFEKHRPHFIAKLQKAIPRKLSKQDTYPRLRRDRCTRRRPTEKPFRLRHVRSRRHRTGQDKGRNRTTQPVPPRKGTRRNENTPRRRGLRPEERAGKGEAEGRKERDRERGRTTGERKETGKGNGTHGSDKTGPGNAGATIRCPGAFRTRFTRRGRRLRCRNERRFFRRHVPHGYPHRERSRADAPDGTVYSSLSVSA